MNEEGDIPTVPEAVQSTRMVSLNDHISPKTDNKTSVFQRFGSLIGRKKKDKAVAESEAEIVAQLKKELDECRKERDRFKIAHLTSESEKKDLMTKMELKSSKIDNLETKIEYEAKLNAKEIESLKRESDILSEKLQASRDEIDRYKNELDSNAFRMTEMDDEIKSKSSEIENLKCAMTGMESEIKSKSEEIDNLKRKLEDEIASSKLETAGQRSLKAFNDTYIRAWQGPKGNGTWYVDLSSDCGGSEHWTITEHNGGKIAIQAHVYRFLRAHPDGRVDLAYVAQEWEQWTPCKNDDGTWSFRSHYGTWLSASREDGIVCTKPHSEGCERFRLESW